MRQRGFTYVGLIITVAIIGLVAALTVKLGALLQRRAAEEELLFVGAAFSDALKSYADATPAGQRREPPSLEVLLKDPRFPGTRRHLRTLYADPMTGSQEWGLVRAGDKIGIIGVYSLSDARPIKIGNFEARFAQFAGKQHIHEWQFSALGIQAPPVPPGAAGAASASASASAIASASASASANTAASAAASAASAEVSPAPAPSPPTEMTEPATNPAASTPVPAPTVGVPPKPEPQQQP